MKDIDADYYGYRDDDDGILIPLELRAERKCMFFSKGGSLLKIFTKM